MKSKLLGAFAVVALAVAPTAVTAQFMSFLEIVQGIGNDKFLRDAGRVDVSPAVRVVRLSTLAGASYGPGRLDDALYYKQTDVAYLQNNLLNNPIAMTAIRNAGVYLEQIVSLTVAGDGSAVLYADDL